MIRIRYELHPSMIDTVFVVDYRPHDDSVWVATWPIADLGYNLHGPPYSQW